RDKSPAALLDSAGLSASLRVMPGLPVYSQTFSIHRRQGPLFKHIVRGVDEIRLSLFANAGAEENPRVCALDKLRAALEIRIHSEKPQLVTAQSDEEAVPRWFAGGQNADRFQPADQPAPLFAGALPPAAPGRHENYRGKRRIAPGDLGSNVEASRCRSFSV